jgi:hypothetical protein
MESAPYFNSEVPDDKKREKKDGRPVIPIGAEAAPPQPPPPAERPPIVHPPLESFIFLRRPDAAPPEPEDHEVDDDDDEDDEDQKEAKKRALAGEPDKQPAVEQPAEATEPAEPAAAFDWFNRPPAEIPQAPTQAPEGFEPVAAPPEPAQTAEYAASIPEPAPVVAETFAPPEPETYGPEHPTMMLQPTPEEAVAVQPAEQTFEPAEYQTTSLPAEYAASQQPLVPEAEAANPGGPHIPFNPFEHPAFGGGEPPEEPPRFAPAASVPAPAFGRFEKATTLQPTPVERRVSSLESKVNRMGYGMLGLLGAVGIEHFVAKGRDHKLEGKLEKWRKKTGQQQEQQQVQQEAASHQLETNQATIQQETRTMRERLASFQQAPEAPTYARPITPAEAPAAFSAPFAAEQRPNPTVVAPEARLTSPIIQPEQSQAAEAVDQFGEPLKIKPNQHIEQSAWHNIVVDKRGREVEGAITYGQGFQQERQQENLRDNIATPQQTTILPTVPMHGAVDPNIGLPSGLTTPTLSTGQPTYQPPQYQLPTNTPPDHKPAVSTPWFWVMIVLIFAAFFIALLA